MNLTTALYITALLGPQKRGVNITRNTGVKIIGIYSEEKLSHLGLDKTPARSTLSDANSNRHYQVFETIYYVLLRQYYSFISDSQLKGLIIRNL